jgi:hypothetical protein
MTHAASQLPATLAGDLIVYFICPLLVVAVAGFISAARAMSRRLVLVEQGLAILIQEVMPPGQASLRSIVNAHVTELARIQGQLSPVPHPGGTA